VLGRPLAIWFLALVAVIAGLSSLVITLQFLDVIPWTGDEVEFWYGKWAGVFLYGLETVVFFAVAVGWLLLKPWAPIFTLIFALLGFFVPLMSYFADTSLFSAIIAPMLFSVLIIVLTMRSSVRQALANAAAAQSAPRPAAAPAARTSAPAAAAPLVRPKGFRSDEV
jgi:hypothetical protein